MAAGRKAACLKGGPPSPQKVGPSLSKELGQGVKRVRASVSKEPGKPVVRVGASVSKECWGKRWGVAAQAVEP